MVAGRRATCRAIIRLVGLAAALASAAGPAIAQVAKPATQSPYPPVQGSANAIAGDMLVVGGQQIRLWGIAAPATGQPCTDRFCRSYDCYMLSTAWLQWFVAQQPVDCAVRAVDVTFGTIATCTINGVDVAAAMVSHGWALAYHRLAPQYAELEARAQSHKLGMWAGRVETPWNWRSRSAAEGLP